MLYDSTVKQMDHFKPLLNVLCYFLSCSRKLIVFLFFYSKMILFHYFFPTPAIILHSYWALIIDESVLYSEMIKHNSVCLLSLSLFTTGCNVLSFTAPASRWRQLLCKLSGEHKTSQKVGVLLAEWTLLLSSISPCTISISAVSFSHHGAMGLF